MYQIIHRAKEREGVSTSEKKREGVSTSEKKREVNEGGWTRKP